MAQLVAYKRVLMYHYLLHTYSNLFIEGRLRSKLSKLIFITLDRSFLMESISVCWMKVIP